LLGEGACATTLVFLYINVHAEKKIKHLVIHNCVVKREIINNWQSNALFSSTALLFSSSGSYLQNSKE
jgi:hypothetical protein